MNNYDNKVFILGYEIRDNDIIINYSNDTIKIIPYSSLEEKKLLKRLRYQLNSYNNILNILTNKYSILFKWLVNEFLLLILFVILISIVKLPIWLIIVGTITLPISLSITSHKLLNYDKKINKIKNNIKLINNNSTNNRADINKKDISDNKSRDYEYNYDIDYKDYEYYDSKYDKKSLIRKRR